MLIALASELRVEGSDLEVEGVELRARIQDPDLTSALNYTPKP